MAGEVVQVGDMVLAQGYCTWASQTSISTIWYKVTDITDPAPDEDQVLGTLDQMFPPHIKATINGLAQYAETSIQLYRPSANLRWVKRISTNLAGLGDIANLPLPAQTTGLIRLHTPFAGRHNRGRMYTPFPGIVAAEETGYPPARYLALLDNIRTVLYVNIPVNGIAPGQATLTPHLRYHIKNPDGTKKEAFQPITVTNNAQVWATQRRRGSFGRPNLPPQ